MVETKSNMNEKCYLCHSSDLEILSDRGRGNIYLCNKVCKICGLAQRLPIPSYEEVISYYKKGTFIDENQDRNYDRMFNKQYAHFIAENREIRSKLLKYAPDIVSNNFRVLEIGSHCGAFLKACKEEFPMASISGVEPDKDIANFAKTKLDKDIYISTLEELEDENIEPYDIIVSFAVLEHIYNPLDFMRIVNKLTKPGGFIFFRVPNIHSHSTGWPFWYDWYLKEHLFHYSPQTITRLFAQSGFLSVEINGKNSLSVLAAKTDKIPQEALEAKDDYRKVLQSHQRFKREHFFYQFTSPIRFAKLCLFLLFGHRNGFKILKSIKEHL